MPSDLSASKVSLNEDSSSSKFDAFVQAVQDALNNLGDATKTSFAAGQVLDPVHIMQSAANVGDALVWNGSQYAPGSASGVRFRKVTPKQVVNTLIETDLLNGEITLPTLGVNSLVRCTFVCDTRQNSGASATARYKLKLGSTLIFDTNVQTVSDDAGRYPVTVTAEIQNLAATNAQTAAGTIDAFMASTTPGGAWTVGETLVNRGSGANANTTHWLTTALAVDTSGAQALTFTVQWSVAHASTETKLWYATVEIL